MGKRNATHILTNQTVFTSAELAAELPTLVDASKAPPQSLLPNFLHEATHHWCFSSTVGTAISLLEMRGQIDLLRAVEASDAGERREWELRAVDDITRAQVASLLLQPLAEGLATFAEFDLTASLRSPVPPPPLRWTMMFNARDQFVGSSATRVRRRMNLAERTGIALIDVRSSEQTQRAKEALLIEPLGCQSGDGYLAGYLLVKSLWRYFRNAHDRYYQPDTFLLKAYDLFYEDVDFVRLLLDRSRTIPAALDPLVRHLEQRLDYAFGDSKYSLDGFFERLRLVRSELYRDDEAKGQVLPLADPLDENPSARFLAMWERVMGRPITSLPGNSNDWSRSVYALIAMHSIGNSRHLLELGSTAVELDVKTDRTVVRASGGLLTTLATARDAPLDMTSGDIHVFLDTRSGDHIAVASSQSKLIALQHTAMSARVDDSAIARSVMGPILGNQAVDVLFQEASHEISRLRELTRLDGYLLQTRERLDGLYAPFALVYVPTAKLPEIVPKMMTDGIYGAFDYDSDLVRAVATIGSSAHWGWNPNKLQVEFERRGLEYETLMRKLREYSRSTNLFDLSESPLVRCSL